MDRVPARPRSSNVGTAPRLVDFLWRAAPRPPPSPWRPRTRPLEGAQITVHRSRLATRAWARRAIFAWISRYNSRRRSHSTLGYIAPNTRPQYYHPNRATSVTDWARFASPPKRRPISGTRCAPAPLRFHRCRTKSNRVFNRGRKPSGASAVVGWQHRSLRTFEISLQTVGLFNVRVTERSRPRSRSMISRTREWETFSRVGSYSTSHRSFRSCAATSVLVATATRGWTTSRCQHRS